jgi:hypothetical protein
MPFEKFMGMLSPIGADVSCARGADPASGWLKMNLVDWLAF